MFKSSPRFAGGFTLAAALVLAPACAHTPPATPAVSPTPVAATSKADEPKPTLASRTMDVPLDELQSQLTTIVLHFRFDDTTLTAEDRQELDKVGEILNQKATKARIRIEGNCDDRGSQEYNLALGQRRADMAKAYLAHLGVAANRIETISFGFNKPVVQGDNEKAWAANRRDELKALAGL